jgi:hypothetical protein
VFPPVMLSAFAASLPLPNFLYVFPVIVVLAEDVVTRMP